MSSVGHLCVWAEDCTGEDPGSYTHRTAWEMYETASQKRVPRIVGSETIRLTEETR